MRRLRLGVAGRMLAVLVVLGVSVFPIYWMFTTALTSDADLFAPRTRLVPDLRQFDVFVDALTEGMAGEWGRSGVRVNTVTPGTTLVARVVERIRTGQRYAVHPEKLTALGRLVEPREVAQAIAFLLSDTASGITGANLAVDAGMMVAPSWDMFGGVPAARS